MNNGTRLIVASMVVGAGVLAGGGESSGGTPTPSQSTAATATPTATPTQAPATVDLSGNWMGTSNGPFNGSFTLMWAQTSGALTGNIMLSSPADNLHISGTVTGSSISFGAVGVVT